MYLGIDIGTGGARGLVVDAGGQDLARWEGRWNAAQSRRDASRHEQSAVAWQRAVEEALAGAFRDGPAARLKPADLESVAVAGTSGTLVPVDETGRPLRWALMYNDARAAPQARRLNALAERCSSQLAYRFDASYALAKALWIAEEEPQVWNNTRWLAHPSDYLVGCLTGCWGVSDWCNALKTGYDPVERRWPDWLAQIPGLLERLPRVVPPATVIGEVSRAAAEATGLREGLPVVSGATDGVAAALASGIRGVGDWHISLGTTTIFKGLSRRIVAHRQGLIYSHKLTADWWLPGAASNVGCGWIQAWFGADGHAAQQLDAAAAGLLGSGPAAYPLVGRGERFPFLAPEAEGFIVPQTADVALRYAACLQGTALVVRLALEELESACGVAGGDLYFTGGGSSSPTWMQCMVDATGRTVRVSEQGSARGAALLAAAGVKKASVVQVAAALAQPLRVHPPNPAQAGPYADLYSQFCGELRRRGYLDAAR